jgi:preprotein translocase subunit SecG
MTILFVILVIIASVILGLIVLIQNPKGGGLSGNIAGFSNQFMGVKQTTDVLEKGTWIFAGVIGVLCLISTMFISGGSSSTGNATQKVGTTTQPAAPSQGTGILNTTPANTQPQANPTSTAQQTTK